MENPFESGHIKNYLLLYTSVVVIVVLFFIASSLFNSVEQKEKKYFETEAKESLSQESEKDMRETQEPSHNFKLLDKAY